MPRIVAIPASKLRRVFEKAGFECVRTEGDHFPPTEVSIGRGVISYERP